MLSDEHRVTPVGRLLAVLDRMRRCEPLRDQLLGVSADGFGAAQLCDRAVTAAQPKPGAKRLCGEAAQPRVDVSSRH